MLHGARIVRFAICRPTVGSLTQQIGQTPIAEGDKVNNIYFRQIVLAHLLSDWIQKDVKWPS